MALRTDFKADVFEGNRKYEISTDAQGKSEILDVTEYAQEGDIISPEVMNAITGAINGLDAAVAGVITVALPAAGWTTDASGLYKQTVAVTDITAEDMPLLMKYTAPDTSKDDGTDYGIDFGMISGGQCAAGSVTFYATDVLAHDITVCLALGKNGDGRLLLGGGGSPEKSEISNVVITITDNAAIAEGGAVTATCNGKSWSSTIKNGKAKLYASEVGNYIITVVTTDAEPVTYTTMLVCPYFGQFSTDIYSGTLVVTCTEDGGNGKTCNVRSCDDEYNPTDAYNLTQTFDTGLELTFLGIPSGKYLVTVDDKYVFFKQIETIQNVNSVKVEFKQWLYNHGDECLWNTGGWLKCSNKYEFKNVNYPNGVLSGTATAKVDFLDDRIRYICEGSAPVKHPNSLYYRAGISIESSFGTKCPLKRDISVYKKMMVSNSNELVGTFRVGSENSTATNISTPTIIQSAAANNMDLAMEINQPFLVLGNKYKYDIVGGLTSVYNSLTIDNNCEISEIYLI